MALQGPTKSEMLPAQMRPTPMAKFCTMRGAAVWSELPALAGSTEAVKSVR